MQERKQGACRPGVSNNFADDRKTEAPEDRSPMDEATFQSADTATSLPIIPHLEHHAEVSDR